MHVKTLLLLILTMIPFRYGLAQSVSRLLDQARTIDNSVMSTSPVDSQEFTSSRRILLQKLLDKESPVSELNLIPGAIPDITKDPRYDQNLRMMITSISSSSQPYVFGGLRVPFPSLINVAALIGKNGNLCTGTLVANKIVLTAGHCVCMDDIKTVYFGSDINSRDGSRAGVVKTLPRMPCEETASNEYISPGNDIGLVWLDKEVGLRPALIADPSLIDRVPGITVVGFGYADTTPLTVGVKFKADVPVVSRSCSNPNLSSNDESYYGCVSKAEMVAAVPKNATIRSDTCRGDSGGPALISSQTGMPLLVATTSRGVKSNGGCGNGGVYELINSGVLAWLREQGLSPVIWR